MDIKKIIKEAFSTILSEEYEGFKNYPTYVVASQIASNSADIQHWIEQAQDIIKKNMETRPSQDHQVSRAVSTAELAATMKDYFNEAPEGQELGNDLLSLVDWRQIASHYMEDEVVQDAIHSMFSVEDLEPAMSLNEALVQEMDLTAIADMPDADYIMVSVKGPGKDEQFGIVVIPRTLKIFFQDPVKFINSITNKRGKYAFMSYITNHKDPNLDPKPNFMQVIKAFKLETHELNPQHEPQGQAAPLPGVTPSAA